MVLEVDPSLSVHYGASVEHELPMSMVGLYVGPSLVLGHDRGAIAVKGLVDLRR